MAFELEGTTTSGAGNRTLLAEHHFSGADSYHTSRHHFGVDKVVGKQNDGLGSAVRLHLPQLLAFANNVFHSYPYNLAHCPDSPKRLLNLLLGAGKVPLVVPLPLQILLHPLQQLLRSWQVLQELLRGF